MSEPLTFRELVDRLGGHPAAALGIRLDEPPGLERWLWVAALSGGRAGESLASVAYRKLEDANLVSREALADASWVTIAGLLATAGIAKPDVMAVLLVGLANAIDPDDGLAAMLRESPDLPTLGSRLRALAPGFGAAGVTRFLRPLRTAAAIIDELPLAPEAAAAAVHLGWLGDEPDLESSPRSLRAALADAPDAPDFRDLEAALARLGRGSCARRRHTRCALAERCPVAAARAGVGVASIHPND